MPEDRAARNTPAARQELSGAARTAALSCLQTVSRACRSRRARQAAIAGSASTASSSDAGILLQCVRGRLAVDSICRELDQGLACWIRTRARPQAVAVLRAHKASPGEP